MACMVSSRKRQEKKGIHLIWVTHDLFDPRIVSRQGVRDQVNRYMRTVFKEEPLIRHWRFYTTSIHGKKEEQDEILWRM